MPINSFDGARPHHRLNTRDFVVILSIFYFYRDSIFHFCCLKCSIRVVVDLVQPLTMTLDVVSTSIISFVQVLDSLGAESWSAVTVCVTSLAVLVTIKFIWNKQRGIDWYCFVHAVVSGVGAVMCAWLNAFAAKEMTGVSGRYTCFRCCCCCH